MQAKWTGGAGLGGGQVCPSEQESRGAYTDEPVPT